MSFVYAFEAKSIQTFIGEGGKLRDLAGGSLLVDTLASSGGDGEENGGGARFPDLIDGVFSGNDLGAKIRFARRAGGAFVAVSDDREALVRFRAAYTLAVQRFAPGLRFTDALVCEGETLGETLDLSLIRLNASSARPIVSLPALTSLTALAPRSGTAAVARMTGDRRSEEGELVGASIVEKRLARSFLKTHAKTEKLFNIGLEARMLPEAQRQGYRWPTELKADRADATESGIYFPGLEENAEIGVVHADGNGLGQILIGIRQALTASNWTDWQAAAGFLLAFSSKIGEATEAAVQQTVLEILVPKAEPQGDIKVLPARPIVLGGDDLTVIVRGDLAPHFTSRYLRLFGEATEEKLGEVRAGLGNWDMPVEIRKAVESALPERLSAGGGVALVNQSHPFAQSSHLAFKLADRAKDAAKDARSGAGDVPRATMSFHRVTTALAGEWGDIFENELLTDAPDGIPRCLTLGVYGVEDGQQAFPPIQALYDLVSLIEPDGFPDSPLRAYLGALSDAPYDAQRNYDRWRRIMAARNSGGLEKFDEILKRLGVPDPEKEPFTAPIDDPREPEKKNERKIKPTPLLDAYAIIGAKKKRRD